MADWMDRNWNLLLDNLAGSEPAASGRDEEPDYLLNDIGPLLYVFQPEWRRQREEGVRS